MMVKPRGCCDRTPEILQSRPMREARQAVAAMRASVATHTTVRPLITLIELRKTFLRL
jgi:hypothetical protein